MVKNSEWIIPIDKPVETVYEIKDKEIRLPKLSEITDKDGKVKLPPELIEKLRDPNARFRVDVVAFPFVDEATALIVARSDAIMTRLNRDYSNVVSLFNHNRKGTVEWLKAEGALTGYNVSHYFRVDFTDETSKNGVKAWSRYLEEIEKYVEKLCRDWYDKHGNFQSRLRKARSELAGHIHRKYYNRFPQWPSVGDTNIGSVEVDTGGAYEADNFYIVWSCVGLVSVKDERPYTYTYMAEFSGNPDTKILQLDFDELGELNRKVNRLGLSEAKRMIDAKQGTRDSRLLTWADFA